MSSVNTFLNVKLRFRFMKNKLNSWNELVKKLKKKYPKKSRKEILKLAKKQYGKEECFDIEDELNNPELFTQKELIEKHNKKVRRTKKKIDKIIG